MSVETPKVEETAPVETKPVEQPTETPAPTETPVAATDKTTTPAEITSATQEPTPEQGIKKNESVVDAVPASEGTLGYKAPGLLK